LVAAVVTVVVGPLDEWIFTEWTVEKLEPTSSSMWDPNDGSLRLVAPGIAATTVAAD
jgi:hypothetical protein